ncbi:hypothetical protein TWF506_002092 [Arthrobotrys conoides]|uniref:Zn(2)-C6 fungal-type domain-containing protein n=1 Tax=Arthrobotrys conoides TaxID=74498 RepID=A0AAN8NHK6_9PEZI
MPKKVVMCGQCRKDKKTCLPKLRKWPDRRCDRCIKYNYKCSEGSTADKNYKGARKAEDKGEHQKLRPAKEIVEELDYLVYLENTIAKDARIETIIASEMNYLGTGREEGIVAASIGILAAELTAEAESARDCLVMRGKTYEAEAIEAMLLRRLEETTVSDKPQTRGPGGCSLDPKGILCEARTHYSRRVFDMHIKGGRIFTILGYVERHTKFRSGPLLRTECGCTWSLDEIPDLESGEKVWELLSMAQSIEFRILARSVYDTKPDDNISEDEEPVAPAMPKLGLLQLVSSINPVGLQATRCLPLKEAIKYIHEIILKGSGSAYGHLHRDCECLDSVASTTRGSTASSPIISPQLLRALGDLHPVIKSALSTRMNSLGLHLPFLNPGIFASHRLDDMSLQGHGDYILRVKRVIPSNGVIWKPGRNPLLPDNPVMKISTKFEINGLSLALAMDVIKFKELGQGRLKSYSFQAAERFRISKDNFIYFFGLVSVKRQLASTWSIAHLKAWNNTLKREHSSYLFPKGATAQELNLSDLVDLYAIGIMHGSQDIIDTLEDAVAGWNLGGPPNLELLEAAQTITTLSIDFAPYLILKRMMTGYWFQHLSFESEISPRLHLRAGFWENMLTHADIKNRYYEPTKACELYRQGYEAYSCITGLVSTTYPAVPKINPSGYDVRNVQVERLLNHVKYCEQVGIEMADQKLIPHRLLWPFPLMGTESLTSVVDVLTVVNSPPYNAGASVSSAG